MKEAVVFGGGQIRDYTRLPYKPDLNNYIICADSGILHCENLGLKADVWVGDFDSCDFDKCSQLKSVIDAHVIKLNPVKDCSDVEYALDYAVEQGYKSLILMGGVGTRLDHTLSNLHLAEKYFDLGITLTVINENNIIHFLKNNSFSIQKSSFKYVSILPLEDCVVSCNGFFYNLSEETLLRNSTRSISNELKEDSGIITIHNGSAFIIESVD